MKTSIKFLFVFAVLVLAAGFFAASDASAQGAYVCQWSTTLNTCTTSPIIGCDPGYTHNCGQFKTQAECNQTQTCELPPNTFVCSWNTNLPTASCVTAEENCLSGYTYNCSGTQLECKSGQVQTCISSGGDAPSVCSPEITGVSCLAGAGETCCIWCDSLDDWPDACADSTYKCNPTGDTFGTCTPTSCTSDVDCGSSDFICEAGNCKPKSLTGGKKLGTNQTTCRWVEGFSSGCVAADTCQAGYIGLYDERWCGGSTNCTGLSKAECDAVPITQCKAVQNWGTHICFADCARGDAGSNLCCNALCGTSFRACSDKSDCLAGADGWECNVGTGICEFTGRGGFDCRSGGLIPCGGLDCPCTFCDIFIIINRVVDLLLFTIAPILVSIMVIVGGFFVLTSRGAGQLRRGKEFIKWAVLGYLLMLIAWVLVNTILSVLDLAEWVGAGDWWDPTC